MGSSGRDHDRRGSRRSYTPDESRHRRRHVTDSERSDHASATRRRSRDTRKEDARADESRRKHRSHRHRHRSRSGSPRRHREDVSVSPRPRSRKPLPSQEESYRGKGTPSDVVDKPIEKQKPNFKPTGLLAAETNKVSVGDSKNPQSIVLKYHEPPEARKAPASQPWIMYVFKGSSQEPLETIPLHTRSCWLLGREAAVADVLTEHPSCSKQHAVFQFRHTVKKDEWGEKVDKVGLYVLDLESANGTFLNGERIDAARYVQCISGDVVKFGDSSREYVILLPPQ